MNLFDNLTADQKRIYVYLQRFGPITKKALQDGLDFTPGTLNRHLIYLCNEGLICETGQEASSGGRKPSLFDICKDKAFIAGIDISRGTVQIVITNLKLNIIAEHRSDVTNIQALFFDSPEEEKYYYDLIRNPDPLYILSHLRKTLSSMLKENHISVNQLLGIGISTVGPVNTDSGILGNVRYFYQYKDWRGLNLKSFFEEQFQVPVWVDCGSYLAVLTEYLYGKYKGTSNMVYFSCGIGLRVGQISRDKIIRTANNDDGMVEHIIIDPMGERCVCGKRGCVRAYSSTFVMSAMVRERIANGELCSIKKQLERVNYRDIVFASQQGDWLCTNVLKEAGRYLGFALANYVTIVNPDIVFLGGKVASISNIYFDSAVESAQLNLNHYPGSLPMFVQGGTYGSLTMVVGAAGLVFEKSVGTNIL